MYYPNLNKGKIKEKASVLLGVILSSNRKNINKIYEALEEKDIQLKD
jgi:hypothetical protein